MRTGVSLNHVWSIVLVIAGSYGALLIFLYFSQSRMLYLPNLPSRDIVATPDMVGLSYEPVKIVTDDGVTLDGWFVPVRQMRGVLLFFHGNAGNISHRLDSLKVFYDLGLATFFTTWVSLHLFLTIEATDAVPVLRRSRALIVMLRLSGVI